MPSEALPNPGTKLEQESLLPELLHALNQPLTSLRCSLELTLLQPRDSEEYRRRLRESLKLTEDITVLTNGIRELLEVEKPLLHPQRVSFDKDLQSAVRELLPLADSEGVTLSLVCAPHLVILGDPQQISTAIVYLLGFLLNLAVKGEDITVQASAEGREIGFTLELARRAPDSDPKFHMRGATRAYLRLMVARRIFEVGGGTVFVDRQSDRVTIRIRIPHIAPHANELGTAREEGRNVVSMESRQ